MTLDYTLGAIVTLGLLVYLVYALIRPENFESVLREQAHDNEWLDSDRALLRDHYRAHKAAGRLHDARLQRRAHAAVAGAAPGGAPVLRASAAWTKRKTSIGWSMPSPCWPSAWRVFCRFMRCSGCRRCCRSIRRAGRGRRASGLQHLGQLHHQHQLAVLCAGNHHELSGADGRADGAQFPLRRDRHRAGGGADPRLCPPFGQRGRQFLGRYDPLHALHPAAGLHRRRPVLHLAGHAAESQRLYRRDNAGRRQAGDRPGPGGFAGSHQDVRHQWRRLLQRQFRASVTKIPTP